MGQLTRAQIVSNGLQLAGDTSLTTLANTWLNAWLRAHYASWPWPYLHKRITGVALAAGTTSIDIGAGSNGVTPEIKRIISPLWLYSSTYSTARKLTVRATYGGDIGSEEVVHDSATWRGTPELIRIRAHTSTWGKWTLVPLPAPDRAYLLGIDYIEQPADLSSDSTVPICPSDRTMIQAVKQAALDYMGHRDEAMAEMQLLSAMATEDRLRYGEVAGTNDMITLDPSVFT